MRGIPKMRSKFYIKSGLVLAMVIFCPDLFSQDSEGFTGAKLLSAPNISVPKEAQETGLGGTISVLVSVDEDGSVVEVEDVNGPGPVCKSVARADVVAMRNSAKESALQAKFSPANKNGNPVKSTMWLSFDFPVRAVEKEKYTAAAPDDLQRFKVVGPSESPGSSGVLNGKAIKLPKPSYPAAARAVKASGAVQIQVLIDENGDIFSAQAVSGHPLLRSSAVVAACGAKFSQTKLEEMPVKVSGIITYAFVP